MRQINLISPDIIQELDKSKIKTSLIITALLIIVSMFIQYAWFSSRSRSVDKRLLELSKQERQFTFIDLERQLQEVEGKIKEIKESNQQYALFLEEDNLCINLLNALSNVTEFKVWFDNLSIDKESSSCKISGYSHKPESASEFVFNLKRLPFFENVELGGLTKSKSDQKEDLVDFSVQCTFKSEGMKKNEETFYR